MDKKRAIIGTIGLSAFAVLVTTAQMHFFSSTPLPHPRLVFWLMVASAVISVLCGIGWLLFSHTKAGEGGDTVRQSVNTGSGDNTGAQIYAARDVHYHAPMPQSVTVPIAPAPQPEPVVEPVPVRQPVVSGTALKINRRMERVIFDYRQRGWRMAQPSEPESVDTLVLWVENPFPTQGQGRDLHRVFASARFEQLDSFTVPRAYWLGQPDNEVHLRSGEKLGVIVGHFDLLGRYVSYSNPHAESFRHILDDGFRPVGPKSTLDLVVRDSSSTPLRIVVTIAQMPSQTIIACKLIVVALPYRYIDMRDCE